VLDNRLPLCYTEAAIEKELKMKRYDPILYDTEDDHYTSQWHKPAVEMEQDPNGDWVRYEDVKALLVVLEAVKKWVEVLPGSSSVLRAAYKLYEKEIMQR